MGWVESEEQKTQEFVRKTSRNGRKETGSPQKERQPSLKTISNWSKVPESRILLDMDGDWAYSTFWEIYKIFCVFLGI